MGEVYRAEDIKLGQTVALKFLPGDLARDPAMLELLMSEVRIARQVSHPDVCRVHDIGELDGQHFISMEFVDGEDLSSLLRRIGRLPQDKAVQISRHLCAGLAAAHDKGVLHQDLKPSNIMIDGRGNVRMTDFGLAILADQAVSGTGRMGTPAYMAPEQAAGGPVTVRSDIYALGLVMYEMFTGKRAFVDDDRSRPPEPSHWLHDLDPSIEHLILRCLDPDPQRRPASALTVAAALPGGDPLATALAAGETPSPEMVAAAGKTGALSRRAGWTIFATLTAGIVLAVILSDRVSLVCRVSPPKPPAVLAERARDLLTRLGVSTEAGDSVHGYGVDRALLEHVRATDAAPDRWRWLPDDRPAAIYFWYRHSDELLQASDSSGRVTPSDPAPREPGMADITLDTNGRLLAFHWVPRDLAPATEPAAEESWDGLFAEAGLDASAFTGGAFESLPPVHADVTRSWTGTLPGVEGIPLRVEAGALRGRPVFFRVLGPWSKSERSGEAASASEGAWTQALWLSLHVAILAGCILLARRNLLAGRGDRKGAFRASAYLGVAMILVWFFQANHAASITTEWSLFLGGAGLALFVASFFWLLYMGLEPYLRRRWPDRIISWSRVLSGRINDPLVGTHLLIGGLFGVGRLLLADLHHLAPAWMGLPPPIPRTPLIDPLPGGREAASTFFAIQTQALFTPVAYLFLILLLTVLLRKPWLASAAFVLIVTLGRVSQEGPMGIDLAFSLADALIILLVLSRFGLLALMGTFLFTYLLSTFPLTMDLSSWHAQSALFALAAALVLASASFVVALGGKPAFAPPE